MSFSDTYIQEFSRISEFYEYDPSDFSSYLKRAEVITGQDFENRAELVNSLIEYNREIGSGQKTEENLLELRKPETLAVVTGQQAGLFTGPLYTIYKACTAVVLAGSMQEKLNKRVVPIFWVASEDHDFEEIDHIYTLNEKSKVKKISISARTFGKPSVGDIALPVTWQKLVDELYSYAPGTEHRSKVVEMLKQTGASAKSLAEWFSKIMANLFSDYGLIFIDPMLPGVRAQLIQGVQRAISEVSNINKAVSEKEKVLRALGYSPQIVKDEDTANLFIYSNRHRETLHKVDEKFFIAGNPGKSWSKQEILELALTEPTRFSPNVVLRPMFQDLILPTLCYVAGPGEIAYYAQLKEVYPLFGLTMPIIYPRKRVTLVEPRMRELIDSYDLNFEEVLRGLEDALDERLKDTLPVDIDQEINCFIAEFEKGYTELLERLTKVDADLSKNIGEPNLHRLKYQLEYLRHKAWQKHRKNNKKLIRDFSSIENYFSLNRKPQERVYNIMSFLINCGPDLLDELLTGINYEDFNHQVLYVGE